MEELIQRVAARAGISAETAQTAIGMIFAFLVKEGPTAEVQALLADLPGAQEAANASASAGGLMAGLAGMIGGGLMGLAARLTGLGLGMGEMQAIGKEVFAFAREKVGDERLDHLVASVPGLKQFV